MATQQPRYMDGTEIRLARQWLQEDDVFVAEIARRLRRSPFSLWRLFGGGGVSSQGCTHAIVLSLTNACSVRANFCARAAAILQEIWAPRACVSAPNIGLLAD